MAPKTAAAPNTPAKRTLETIMMLFQKAFFIDRILNGVASRI